MSILHQATVIFRAVYAAPRLLDNIPPFLCWFDYFGFPEEIEGHLPEQSVYGETFAKSDYSTGDQFGANLQKNTDHKDQRHHCGCFRK